MAENPYAPPKTRVADVPPASPEGDFCPGGRSVAVGNGWRWIADAWAFMHGQRLVFLGVFLLLWLANLALNLATPLGALAASLLLPAIVGGLVLGCDAVRRGHPLEVGHLFAGFQRHAGKLLTLGAIWLGVGIVLGVIALAIVGASLGSILFTGETPTAEQLASLDREAVLIMLLALLVVLALSLPATMALLFAPALIVLAEADVLPAIKASFMGCLKNVLPFLFWSVAALVLMILALPLIIVGWLLLGSVLMVSLYLSYRDVFYKI
jgi:hypothetical protein